MNSTGWQNSFLGPNPKPIKTSGKLPCVLMSSFILELDKAWPQMVQEYQASIPGTQFKDFNCFWGDNLYSLRGSCLFFCVCWQENLQEVCDALSYSSISVDIIPSTQEAACIQQLFFHKLCACQLCLLPGSTGAVPVGPRSHFCDC